MSHAWRSSAITAIATGGIVTAMAVPAVAGDGSDGDGNGEVQQVVDVVGNGTAVHLDNDEIYSGSVQFRVSTTAPQTQDGGGSNISLFQLKPGKTLADVTRSLHEEFSQDPQTAAMGTRDIVATADIFGLADVVPGHPATVTEFLKPGDYWLMDVAGVGPDAAPKLTHLDVDAEGRRNIEQDSDLSSQVHVSTVDDRFVAPTRWPHEGTYTFTNNADTIHFMDLQPVKPGTTDKDVQAFFDTILSGGDVPPPFIPGPTGGNDVVSPGNSLQVSYDLPPGTYVMLCFVADDKTGLPHAFMGMHQVIELH